VGPFIRAFCGFANGVAPDRMSVTDYLAYDKVTAGRNQRVPAGYGTLVAASLPPDTVLRMATPVQAIKDDGPRLIIEAPRGNLSARAAILMVSTAILSGSAIKMPALLAFWQNAANLLPLGSGLIART